jgi:hypothetical protein
MNLNATQARRLHHQLDQLLEDAPYLVLIFDEQERRYSLLSNRIRLKVAKRMAKAALRRAR